MRFSRTVLAASVAVIGSAAAAVVTADASAASPGYTIIDLGSLGYGVTDGLGIDANGQVMGYSYSSQAFEVT